MTETVKPTSAAYVAAEAARAAGHAAHAARIASDAVEAAARAAVHALEAIEAIEAEPSSHLLYATAKSHSEREEVLDLMVNKRREEETKWKEEKQRRHDLIVRERREKEESPAPEATEKDGSGTEARRPSTREELQPATGCRSEPPQGV